jgi:hypothetical protein
MFFRCAQDLAHLGEVFFHGPIILVLFVSLW